MRTVLIGTDFVYNKNGDIVPIEINTNIGFDNRFYEKEDEVFELESLKNFIVTRNFNKVIYIGNMALFSSLLKKLCETIQINFEYILTVSDSLTIPNVIDDETTLIIRSAYDTTAIVDDTYCRDKINFLNLIKSLEFKSEFAYLDTELINNITKIPDNGNHPNFILKKRNPNYDKNVYPKLFKVDNFEQLNEILLNQLDSDNFLMEFHINENELYQNHIKIIRGLTLWYPSNLESIYLGGYTTFSSGDVMESSSYSDTTFEILKEDRVKYLYNNLNYTKSPKLLDDDLVEMADNSFKTGRDLQVGDIVKTIAIPNLHNADNSAQTVNYQITYEQLITGSYYTTNKVVGKAKISQYSKITKLTFEDETTWFDTQNSSYLTLRNDEVRFCVLNPEASSSVNFALRVDDEIILLDSTNIITPSFVKKKVKLIESVKDFFSGYTITVEQQHLFLTKTENTSNNSFVAIEHNTPCSGPAFCFADPGQCGKEVCCGGAQLCVPNCGACDDPPGP